MEIRSGSETQASEYCKKEGTVLIDKGFNYDEVEPVLERKRKLADVFDQFADDVEAGANFGVLRQKYRRFCFFNRRAALQYLADHRYYKSRGEAADDPLP